MINITKKVDDIVVTPSECKIAIKYLMRHRREYKTIEELDKAFNSIIRQIRGGDDCA